MRYSVQLVCRMAEMTQGSERVCAPVSGQYGSSALWPHVPSRGWLRRPICDTVFHTVTRQMTLFDGSTTACRPAVDEGLVLVASVNLNSW